MSRTYDGGSPLVRTSPLTVDHRLFGICWRSLVLSCQSPRIGARLVYYYLLEDVSTHVIVDVTITVFRACPVNPSFCCLNCDTGTLLLSPICAICRVRVTLSKRWLCCVNCVVGGYRPDLVAFLKPTKSAQGKFSLPPSFLIVTPMSPGISQLAHGGCGVWRNNSSRPATTLKETVTEKTSKVVL